jgi:hypothetical protein
VVAEQRREVPALELRPRVPEADSAPRGAVPELARWRPACSSDGSQVHSMAGNPAGYWRTDCLGGQRAARSAALADCSAASQADCQSDRDFPAALNLAGRSAGRSPDSHALPVPWLVARKLAALSLVDCLAARWADSRSGHDFPAVPKLADRSSACLPGLALQARHSPDGHQDPWLGRSLADRSVGRHLRQAGQESGLYPPGSYPADFYRVSPTVVRALA